MGTLEAPVWGDNMGTYAAAMDRSVLGLLAPVPGILAPDATGITTAGNEGVVSQHAGTQNLSVDIVPFRSVVGESGTTNASWRTYLCKHSGTAVTNQTMPAAPTTAGQSRYDAVCVQVQDSTVSGAANNWQFVVVQGTATSGTPAFPSTPAGMYLVLAYVLRPANQTQILNSQIINVANRLWFDDGIRLAYAKYNPGTFTQSTTITNAFAPIVPGGIGTGWNLTFTVPPTGKVKARISMYTGWSVSGSPTPVNDAQGQYWALVDSSNAAPAGAAYAIHHWSDGVTAGTGLRRNQYEAHITGLTPGAALTWWPAWRKSSQYGGTAYNQVSSANGDFWCAVYADA